MTSSSIPIRGLTDHGQPDLTVSDVESVEKALGVYEMIQWMNSSRDYEEERRQDRIRYWVHWNPDDARKWLTEQGSEQQVR